MAEKKESKSVLERTYTVPLRKAFVNSPKYRKTNRAVSALRAFLIKHMKGEDVRLGQHVNEFLWQNGIKSPPPRVTVHAVKDEEGVIRAELEGKAFKESVRPVPKEEEPSNLKERISQKLGAKEEAPEAQKAEKPPKEAKPKAREPKAPAEPKSETPAE